LIVNSLWLRQRCTGVPTPKIRSIALWSANEPRPYRSVDDLDRVKGIGKRRLEETRPLVRAE
jgi:DNA uptake protein ComE-like DNA-binding protein